MWWCGVGLVGVKGGVGWKGGVVCWCVHIYMYVQACRQVDRQAPAATHPCSCRPTRR